jgi:hypothetical protein
LSGKEFYRKLRKFLSENPNKNKKLADEFIGMARGKIAEYFVGDDLKKINKTLYGESQKIQEPINKYVEIKQVSSIVQPEPEVEAISDNIVEPIEVEIDTDQMSSSDESTMDTSEELAKELDGDSDSTSISNLDSTKSDLSLETTSEHKPASSKRWPTLTSFMIKLQGKLSESGFEIIRGVVIPGIDLAANNPESFIKRVFFCYMPRFDNEKAMNIERSLERFTPELCILIGPSEDTDLRLFAVGKNMAIVDFNKILNTDYIIHLEDQI